MPADMRSDSELMKALAAGEREPLGVLYLRYGKLVYSVVNRYVPGLERRDLEDLCQEVFLSVLDQARRYTEGGQLRSWVCGIAIRKARELRRKHWLHRNLIERFFTPNADRSDAGGAATSDAKMDVDRGLAILPPDFREVMLLSMVEGLSGEEIAAALGIRINTVWTRLHRARAMMREHFHDEPSGGAP